MAATFGVVPGFVGVAHYARIHSERKQLRHEQRRLGILVKGDLRFQRNVVSAILLLEGKDPEHFRFVTNHMRVILQDDKSPLCHTDVSVCPAPVIFNRETTSNFQWCAAELVHEAEHIRAAAECTQRHIGLLVASELLGTNAEVMANAGMAEALQKLGAPSHLITYVRNEGGRHWDNFLGSNAASLIRAGVASRQIPLEQARPDLWSEMQSLGPVSRQDCVGCALARILDSISRADWAGAISNSDAAIRLKPDVPQAYLGRATAELRSGNFDAALVGASSAVRLDPTSTDAYFTRANAEHARGDLDAALADYQKAIDIDPQLASAYRMRGFVHYDRHEFAEALTDLRKARELGPEDDYMMFRTWLAESRLGQASNATPELVSYLARRPPRPLGDWPWFVGRFLADQTSEADLLAAAGQQHGAGSGAHGEAWFYIGSKRLLRGDSAGATACFEKCVATGDRTLTEYRSALSELELLRSPPQETNRQASR